MKVLSRAKNGNYGPFLLHCMLDVRDGVVTVIPVGNDGYEYLLVHDEKTGAVGLEMKPFENSDIAKAESL